ncbi:hypothetical protein [Stenotrophomonas sepilia]|uniref:hypothetical protein n=1 Tax=Stenotrophomonas sepilia TaxID=2860290 RepID=UPI003EE74DE3
MPQKLIDQTTIQPDGRPGDDAFTAFATCNDNFEDAEQRLSALESGSSNIGQDVADLKTGLQQEQEIRLQGDDALGLRIDAEQAARQALAQSLGARFIGKNRLINGSMRWWQRGTNFTSPGYSVDRWYFNAGGVNTPSVSRNPITPGSSDTECIYFAKIAYGAVTDAANHYVVLEQRMENVTTLAGRTVTLSLKVFNSGAAGRQIAIEFGQSFGAGGSAQVSGIGAAKYSLEAGLNTITHVAQIPSISGKTVGANSSLILTLWATGGSNFNARNASLGAQAGDVHFTQVQVEEGSSASAFEYRHDELELMLCQRFYEKSYDIGVLPGSVSVNGRVNRFYDKQGGGSTADVRFTVRKRAPPAVAIYNDQTGQINSISAANGASGTVSSVINIGETGCQVNYLPASSWGAAFHYTADAEI